MTDSSSKHAANNVILLGASTRAAAMSALRAGMTPWCVDLFADADLCRIASVRKVPSDTYPHCLLTALRDAPNAPVIYTGALENAPGLIARIDRPLWGNPPAVLRNVRSPERWTQCLREQGVPCPAISTVPMHTGRWLLKARKSGGGLGVQRYAGQAFDPRTHFLQEQIEGTPVSAIFLGDHDHANLLGVTRQLIGTSWLNALGFHYAGNIGPLPLDADVAGRWRTLGAVLARAFQLRGLFGVDAVLRDGVPWPIEINPRYTASVELLERSSGAALLGLHRDVFANQDGEAQKASRISLASPRAGEEERNPQTVSICGKAILYARADRVFPADGPWCLSSDHADLPHAGELVERGRPVLTLFASATTVADCETKLQEKAQTLDRALWG